MLKNSFSPRPQEYPDYYDVIKKPIDMDRMHAQMAAHKYASVDDMVQDFLLMFDNACKYNEPDSLIYKVSGVLRPVGWFISTRKLQLWSRKSTF